MQEIFHALLLELPHAHGLARFRIAPAAVRLGDAIRKSACRRGEALRRAFFLIGREPALRRDATREAGKRHRYSQGHESCKAGTGKEAFHEGLRAGPLSEFASDDCSSSVSRETSRRSAAFSFSSASILALANSP